MTDKADELRESIRQRIVSGRDRHTVVAKIIEHSKLHVDYWERATVAQVMNIYKLSKADSIAIVAEMSYYPLDKSHI